jgi:FtsH-binding integral membrane protein
MLSPPRKTIGRISVHYLINQACLNGIVWIVLTVGLLNMLFRIDFISTLLSIVFAIIYMIYIVVDTQLIMGGEKG